MARRWESKGRGREGGEDGGDAWRTAVLASVRARGRERMGRWEGGKENGGTHCLEGEVEGLRKWRSEIWRGMQNEGFSLFVWLVAEGGCWFVLR
jgi:hypothetical protein